VGSAGLGANLLLNIGPTPEGEVREAHKERLLAIGDWLKVYGETIYGTRKSFMKTAEWGVAVENGDTVYLHIIHPEKLNKQLILNQFPYKVNKAYCFETGKTIDFKEGKSASSIILQIAGLDQKAIDNVVVLSGNKTIVKTRRIQNFQDRFLCANLYFFCAPPCKFLISF